MNRTLLMSALALMAGSALAIDFENPPYNGSAAGTLLTGQDGWYLPAAGGADWNVYTYAGNTLGVVANPGGGGSQFAAGRSLGANARAQKDFNWGSAPGFDVSYDVNNTYSGQPPAVDNIASWSLQDSVTSRSMIALNTWTDPNTATNWDVEFNVFDAAGVATNNLSPGAAWTNLTLNHWYRLTHRIDFTNNAVVSTTILDLHTGVSNTFNPTGWYLTGGSAPTAPLPTGYRFFAGGTTPGNTNAVDNFTITPVPEPGTFVAIGAGLALLVARRRRK
jgi:hypothetical protein